MQTATLQTLTGNDKRFNLRLYLSLTTGIAVLILGVVLWALISNVVKTSLVNSYIRQAETLAEGMHNVGRLQRNTLATPDSGAGVSDNQPPPEAPGAPPAEGGAASAPRNGAMSNFEAIVQSFNITAIRAYDANGCVVMGEANLNGVCVATDAQLQTTLATSQTQSILRRAGENDPFGAVLTQDTISVYVANPAPPSAAAPAGLTLPQVFAINQEIPDLAHTLHTINWLIAGVVGFIMGGFLLIQAYFARQAEGIIHAQQDLLETRNRELEALQQLKDDLTHMIIHDLKNPLTSIMGHLGLLLSGREREKLSAAQAEQVQRAHAASQRLLDLIMNLLNITQMEAGRLTLKRETLTLQTLAREIATHFDLELAARDQHLSIDIPAELPPVLADADIVRRVLTNLLSNAIKHTARAGHIAVRAEIYDGAACVAVQDSGEGIPAEAIPQLFEKFNQVASKQLGKKTDTGLGLAFCKLAVEAHGGRIWVESIVGQGSTFSFTLPLTQTAS